MSVSQMARHPRPLARHQHPLPGPPRQPQKSLPSLTPHRRVTPHTAWAQPMLSQEPQLCPAPVCVRRLFWGLVRCLQVQRHRLCHRSGECHLTAMRRDKQALLNAELLQENVYGLPVCALRKRRIPPTLSSWRSSLGYPMTSALLRPTASSLSFHRHYSSSPVYRSGLFR